MNHISNLSHNQNEQKDGIIEKQEYPQARDILIHFNKNIYPEIEQKYHPEKGIIQEKTGKKILQLFGLIKTKETVKDTERSYKELGIQTAQGITDFILGENSNDPTRIQLLLQAIWLDMMSDAYCNIYLDYSYAADRYGENGDMTKKQIIKECLKICDNKFRGRVATLTFTEDFIMISTKDGGTTIQSKSDFINTI